MIRARSIGSTCRAARSAASAQADTLTGERSMGLPRISRRSDRTLWSPRILTHSCTRLSPCAARSEEHTSELQSRPQLVCSLLLEKKKRCRVLCESRQRIEQGGQFQVLQIDK